MSEMPACHENVAHHSEKVKKNLISRLNRIEGQVRGIARMISEDIYCDDILNQIMSIEAALRGVKKSLLEAHIKDCVVEQVEQGKMAIVDELLVTIERMIR